MAPTSQAKEVVVDARDGAQLAATLFLPPSETKRAVVINSAIATPRHFYSSFAGALAEAGYSVLAYDYRGVAGSRPKALRGFRATVRDWAMLDMAGVVDWTKRELQADRTYLVGHSLGGQVPGLLDNAALVDGLVTFSSQSGHWRLQGGEQKAAVLLHAYVTLPLLSRAFGYMPWKLMGGEDLPKEAALEWARWCRHPNYLLGDDSLPLERYGHFTAPVLAYSFGDDKWGTARAVDAMMSAYPNLERRHVDPSDINLPAIGHFGFFKPKARCLWQDVIAWLDAK